MCDGSHTSVALTPSAEPRTRFCLDSQVFLRKLTRMADTIRGVALGVSPQTASVRDPGAVRSSLMSGPRGPIVPSRAVPRPSDEDRWRGADYQR
jgi:hypothetical protein